MCCRSETERRSCERCWWTATEGNKLESTHQFGVIAGIVPKGGQLVVLTPEGAVAVRTVRMLSQDQVRCGAYDSQNF